MMLREWARLFRREPTHFRPDTDEEQDAETALYDLGRGETLPAGHARELARRVEAPVDDVRLHTDARGANAAGRAGARALTVGSHVAFAPGQFEPGTLRGDALLAHELAHAAQQTRFGTATDNDSETAANEAAASSLIGKSPSRNPSTGLRISRCPRSSKSGPAAAPWSNPDAGQDFGDWLSHQPTAEDKAQMLDQMPEDLRKSISGDALSGHEPDCADVALILRHHWLQSQNQTQTFKAGPAKTQLRIGQGVSNTGLRGVLRNCGAMNFMEPRTREQNVIEFERHRENRDGGTMDLAALSPGDVVLWRYVNPATGKARSIGHTQTVQRVDTASRLIYIVQGTMEGDSGAGTIAQRVYTFDDFAALDGSTVTLSSGKWRMEFVGSGPWRAPDAGSP